MTVKMLFTRLKSQSGRQVMRLFLALAMFIFSVLRCDISLADEKNVPFLGFSKYAKYHSDYAVNPDGTHIYTGDFIIEVLTNEGVSMANQQNVSYSESLEELTILSAYTLKNDGRRIDVPAANIQERTAVAGGGPMYSDIKTRVIIFPEVAAGDKVGYSYKLVRKTAVFPGHFSLLKAFTKDYVYDDVKIIVSVPVDTLKLNVFSANIDGGHIENKDKRMRWSWTYKNQTLVTHESGSVSQLDYGSRIVISSFNDYGEVAAAYEARAKDKSVPTDRVKKLANEIVADGVNKSETARLLYNWVSKNIRYAGNCIGVGSVVPHDTDMILDNRLGDCKDHTALLQALLSAKGIESTAALVNHGNSFKLPPVATPDIFNHVINYIPSLALYLDSTSEYTPFGLLPLGELGKPTIHTAKFDGIMHIKPSDYNRNSSYMKMTLKINKDGSADGETSNEEKGIFSGAVRAAYSMLQPNMEDKVMRSMIARNGYKGSGKITKGDVHDMSDGFIYGGSYHIDNFINIPGPGAIFVTPIIPSAIPIVASFAILNEPEPKLDHGCFGGISTEEYSIYFPDNIRVIALPKDIHIGSDKVTYDATYNRKGNVVTIVRKVTDKTAKSVCSPREIEESRKSAETILKDTRTQIIYE